MAKMVTAFSLIALFFLSSCGQSQSPPEDSDAPAEAITLENEQLALDLAEWGMPVVSFFAQKEANERDMGTQPNQILYWSQPFDHNNKILTPNDTVLYISAQIETFDGPMVLEVPPTEGPLGIFGSLLDPFMVPLEDVGGTRGIDQGAGGKILITPAGYDDEVPNGYLHVPSAHYNTVAGFRITPDSFQSGDIAAAINYVKRIKLYRLNDERPTVFVDGGNKPYDPRPPYDEDFFRLLDLYVQTETHKEIDEEFIDSLAEVGIVKGQTLQPDASHARIAKKTKETLQTRMRDIGEPFFADSNWTTPASPVEPETAFTYVSDDGTYHWRVRAVTFHWAIWAPKHLGSDTFYLVGQRDSEGAFLDARETYSLTVPANVPAEKFWSVTVYEFETGSFFDDVSDVAVTSKQEDLAYNDDGSVTLTFGPATSVGAPAANHVPTVGERTWFALFRWYGPQPELFPAAGDDRWTLGDFERLTGF